ncbi:hypothetical protein HBI56_021530 [Parastagonospora nodorum]|nr:hypothetical protein HBH56_174500 [Parastagonospora nodorum]KAH3926279.1 hypothetical protein HBH54_168650 [Parastagonospora nodorum]KAH3971250.1 hypothetical protein HBH51_111010 [Parastagonospora nodorum]KAH4041274.1 hypothetical protein HBI09_020510 [Parastagonospora nodorum]KAH4058173.1 hypothetical protein HBH49_029610 [Parastagonospora nodorum]
MHMSQFASFSCFVTSYVIWEPLVLFSLETIPSANICPTIIKATMLDFGFVHENSACECSREGEGRKPDD